MRRQRKDQAGQDLPVMVTVAIGRLIARPPSSPCKSKISRCTMQTMPTNKSDRITRASGCIRTGMHGHVRLETTKRASQNHAMHRYRSAAIDTGNYSTGTVQTPQQKNKSPTQANFMYKRCHAWSMPSPVQCLVCLIFLALALLII